MRIMILGAGSIGSLFGAFLAKCGNDVVLIRRSSVKHHEDKPVRLTVTGKTSFTVDVPILTSPCSIPYTPDLVLLTVKSYDTDNAAKMLKNIMDDDSIVLSLQNGLGNLEKISRVIKKGGILGGVTTYGAYLSDPLVVEHTGIGETIIGAYQVDDDKKVRIVAELFNNAGIKTRVTRDLNKELWVKAIVNSSINPLSAFFECRNGYLYENPILRRMVELVCKESTMIARANGVKVSCPVMLKKTFRVISDTKVNISSMLQSLSKGKKTEIDAINGVLVDTGRRLGCDVSLNNLLLSLIHIMENEPSAYDQ